MIFNDAECSVFIEDPSGNTWKMDAQGNIEVNAPKDIIMNAGDNIAMTAGVDVSVNAGLNINETAGENKSTTVGMFHNLSVGTDYMIHVIGKMTVYIKGNKESRTEKERTRISNGKIVTQSQDTHEQHSDKVVKNNSDEKTSMY